MDIQNIYIPYRFQLAITWYGIYGSNESFTDSHEPVRSYHRSFDAKGCKPWAHGSSIRCHQERDWAPKRPSWTGELSARSTKWLLKIRFSHKSVNHHFPINCHHFMVFLWCFLWCFRPCFFGKPHILGADSRGFPGDGLEPSNVMWWTQVSLVTCQHATVQRFRLATATARSHRKPMTFVGNQWKTHRKAMEINGKSCVFFQIRGVPM